MTGYFTHYWQIETVDEHRARGVEGLPFTSLSDNRFSERGVKEGAYLYEVTVRAGDLYLICRVEVDHIEPSPDDGQAHRWKERVIVREGSGTPAHFDHLVPDEVAHHLLFDSPKCICPPVLTDGKLDQQTLRGVRRLTPESAADLDRLIAEYEVVLDQERTDVKALEAEEGIYVEGYRSQSLINRYERNAGVRAAAKRIHGIRCQVCGFSFEDVYGEHGAGFIEVHHLVLLASTDGEVHVDPRTDVAVLCANCHRMIHRNRDHILTLDELRMKVRARSAPNP